jgi:hypothetical protein
LRFAIRASDDSGSAVLDAAKATEAVRAIRVTLRNQLLKGRSIGQIPYRETTQLLFQGDET